MAISQDSSETISTHLDPLVIRIIKKYSGNDINEKDLLVSTTDTNDLELRKTARELLIKALKECEPGDPGNTKYYPKRYEEISYDIIQLTFESEFPNEKPDHHPKINYFLYGTPLEIRDIVLQNNPENYSGTFWAFVGREDTVHCQRIVFECKNYNKPIQAEEIYQLYGYLNPETHGYFGIVLCRDKKKTYLSQAMNAVKRVLIDRYVILVFDDTDVERWLDHWVINGSVGEFFNNSYKDNATAMSKSVIDNRKNNGK